MTDKEIIIHGVNVSECKYFKTNYKEDCDVKIDNCCCDTYVPCWSEYKYDCYFKQLTRKTQECETLSSQLDFEVQKKECLEQECEELEAKMKI